MKIKELKSLIHSLLKKRSFKKNVEYVYYIDKMVKKKSVNKLKTLRATSSRKNLKAKRKDSQKVVKKISMASLRRKASRRVISVGRFKGTFRMKMMFALRKLIFFAILAIASLLLMGLSSNKMFVDLFMLLYIIFGALTLAFLVVFLVFLLLDVLRKK